MSKSNSTPANKPVKPYPEFPLFPHAAGVWAKKIRGKLHYFGPWNDPDGALAKYLEQKDALHAGREPRPDPNALTVKELANKFFNFKRTRTESGELTLRSWLDYKDAADLLIEQVGKQRLVADIGPDDFADLRNRMAQRWGPVQLGNIIQRVRSIFKYAFDSALITVPVRFGPGFARPSKKTLRLHRAEKGPKIFSREEIHGLMGAAGTALRAMMLLGVNCGFGNADCGKLRRSALNLETGWVDYPRPKTGIPRRCPLWPETIEALKASLQERPEPSDPEHADLVFVTKYGQPWAKETPDSPISKETAKLLRELGINGRKGTGFYTLRHVFETVGGEAKDQIAVDHIMGHEAPGMASVYRERISDERLKAVTYHVRQWLYGEKQHREEEEE